MKIKSSVFRACNTLHILVKFTDTLYISTIWLKPDLQSTLLMTMSRWKVQEINIFHLCTVSTLIPDIWTASSIFYSILDILEKLRIFVFTPRTLGRLSWNINYFLIVNLSVTFPNFRLLFQICCATFKQTGKKILYVQIKNHIRLQVKILVFSELTCIDDVWMYFPL
jgi:hypothetical protein